MGGQTSARRLANKRAMAMRYVRTVFAVLRFGYDTVGIVEPAARPVNSRRGVGDGDGELAATATVTAHKSVTVTMTATAIGA